MEYEIGQKREKMNHLVFKSGSLKVNKKKNLFYAVTDNHKYVSVLFLKLKEKVLFERAYKINIIKMIIQSGFLFV